MPGVPIRDIQPWRRLNSVLLNRRIARWLSEQGCKSSEALLWIGIPTDYALDAVLEFGDAFSVYDVAQIYSESQHLGSSVTGTESTLLESVDLILADSKVVAKSLGQSAPAAVIVPQGVDVELFRPSRRVRREGVVGYLGSENQAFDARLMREVVGALPAVRFELAGDFDSSWESANVHVLGPVAHSELPIILGAWSVGIVPYKLNAFTAGVLPTKVLEYRAAGLPVVSTGLDALRGMGWPGIHYADDTRAFAREIEAGIMKGSNEEPDWSWLDAQSWDARFESIERALQTQGVHLPADKGHRSDCA